MSLTQKKGRSIGRLEILAWLNRILESDYSRIEDLCDGVAYCLLFDSLYPGKIFRCRGGS
jgi:Microtubule-binding protein involved in cell cycle control